MANDTKHRCAGITRLGQPCKNMVPASRVFCCSHTPLLTFAESQKVLASMRELGMLKAGERPMREHNPWCPHPHDAATACTCQEVKLEWPDYHPRVEAAR